MIAALLAGLGALSASPQALVQTVLGAPWKTGGVVLALGLAGFLWLWIGGLRAEIADLRAERLRLHHEAALNRALLAERDRVLAALAEAETQAEARRKAARAAREEVRDAPETEDGLLAPVLRRALERLR